jgi:hypothetical protein
MAKTLKNRKPRGGKKQRKSSKNIGKTGGMFKFLLGHKSDFNKLVASSNLTRAQQDEAFSLKRLSTMPTNSGTVAHIAYIRSLKPMSDEEIIEKAKYNIVMAKYKQGRASRRSSSGR